MDYLDQMKQLQDEGQPFVLATVVRVEKPTSARPGANAIITEDGRLTGWIGGSCAEPTVIREAAKVLQDGDPRLLRLCPPEKMGTGPQEGVTEVKLTCMSGGTLEIYLEPHRPKPHLLLIGHLPVVESLVAVGKALDYTVTVMGLEVSRERFQAADRVLETLDLSQAEITPDTYVVVASHGNYDEAALEAILTTQASYVALVASKKRVESIRQYLRDAGLSDSQISHLKCPAGLDIGAANPPEIAISILAEIVQIRRRKPQQVIAESGKPAKTPYSAIDPVCGMTVTIDTARYVTTYHDEKVYFCSSHCLHSFEKDPEKYLHPMEAGQSAPAFKTAPISEEHSKETQP